MSEHLTDWVERVREAYENGASDVEICAVMKITYSQFQDAYMRDSNFRKAVDIGRAMSKAWWYSQGRRNIGNNKFNTALWNFNMKNLFGWADKTENVNQEVTDESVDALASRLEKLLPGVLGKLHPGATQAQLLEKTSGGSGEH